MQCTMFNRERIAVTRDLNLIRDVLVGVLPDGERITGIRAFSTGHSNETYLIEGLDQILRLPPSVHPLLPDSHGVIDQGRIYEALNRIVGAPPVPAIVYSCEDPALLGDPFFVMGRVAGEEINDYLPQPWFGEASPSDRALLCQKWIDAFCNLGKLATIEALGPIVTPEDEARRWRRFALEARCDPLVASFDRLLKRPAPRSGPPSPAHGDPKLANLMWSNGDLAAVLDWELGYNGEPLADLGYIIAFFASDAREANKACGYAGMWKRDQIIDYWASMTGRSGGGVRWHETAAIGKMAAIIAYGYNLYSSGKSDDERFLKWKAPIQNNLGIMDIMLRSLGV